MKKIVIKKLKKRIIKIYKNINAFILKLINFLRLFILIGKKFILKEFI